jgi:hypothetical protein
MDVTDCEKWWAELSPEMKRYVHATSTSVDLTSNREMWIGAIEKLHRERMNWVQGKRVENDEGRTEGALT